MTPSPSAAPIMNPAQARGARGLTAAAMIAHISVKVPMTSQMKPPNGERAIVDIAKLTDYCLNPEHARGKHKARIRRRPGTDCRPGG